MMKKRKLFTEKGKSILEDICVQVVKEGLGRPLERTDLAK